VVALAEDVARKHVVVEQAAVVHHPSHHLHVVGRRRIQAQLARPRLERVEDDHRPVDAFAEALEAVDQVEREPVRGSRRDTDALGEAGVAQGRHAVPDRLAGVARAIRLCSSRRSKRSAPTRSRLRSVALRRYGAYSS